MPSRLIAPPAIEPITLAEAKLYLRVEHNDDDAVIAALITAARALVEAATRRVVITQTWRHTFDAWPSDGVLAILPAPARAVAAARVYDHDGVAQAVDPQAFVLDEISAPSRLSFAPWALPAPGRALAGIEIDVVAGHGDTAADVPEPLRQAVRALLAHWYENRGVVSTSSASPLPAAIAALIAPYRILSL